MEGENTAKNDSFPVLSCKEPPEKAPKKVHMARSDVWLLAATAITCSMVHGMQIVFSVCG